MQRHDIPNLIKRYNSGTCSDEEKELIESWYLQFEQTDLIELSEAERKADLDNIWNALPINQQKVRKMNTWYRVAAAATILLFLSISIYFIANRVPDQEVAIHNIARVTVPGGNRAVLTLGNGSRIILTGARNGTLATQQNIVINKTADGQVVYNADAKSTKAGEKVAYNTMTTPQGGMYDLTLSDGTRVMLDAASSIRYPVVFNGYERRVEITGQAYFEVVHNKAKPFRVITNGQTVEVLGTHFNVNAYADEPSTQTTLLEGSVKVTKGTQMALLAPGQQAVIFNGANAIKVKTADTETAIAWKNGVFSFKRADLKTVMRQFARWYDVQVTYEGDAPDAAITGKVLRSANASHVLQIVSDLGIKFKTEGKKIIIIKK